MHKENNNNWISLGDVRVRRYNGGQLCDMLIGPCACGATHDKEDLRRYVKELHQEIESLHEEIIIHRELNKQALCAYTNLLEKSEQKYDSKR